MASTDAPRKPAARPSLAERLAGQLPKGLEFQLHHLSTPPSRTSALVSPPDGSRPEKTFCESHFVTLSIQPKDCDGAVLVFAIEVLIYTTAHLTTLFVSKADSTGYLHLLGVPKGAPSTIRAASATVLSYLIECRQRPGVRSVVSLFARAADQYLFPGSIEYSGKHVQDDRALVRWWCKTLHQLPELTERGTWESVEGYLVVPGFERLEMAACIPPLGNLSWKYGHPLVEMALHPSAPPRCLIPHFPDDPKARFVTELDDELTKSKNKPDSGHWRSVRSLEQFWEMMAFRQECSAGRVVGFIWVVFRPAALNPTEPKEEDHGKPADSRSRHVKGARRPARKLTGPVKALEPCAKTLNKALFKVAPETPYYAWPVEGRGQLVVDEKNYKRIGELLLRLDFADLNLARGSSQRWIDGVQACVAEQYGDWGTTVVGTLDTATLAAPTASAVNNLGLGLVRKKRKGGDNTPTATPPSDREAPAVNVLSASVIRKKPKPSV